MALRKGEALPGGHYSIDDASSAIERLTPPELLKLSRVAEVFMSVFGGISQGRDSGDLLREAILRTLDGRRSWAVGVELVYHLVQVMRSIVSSWSKSLQRGRPEVSGSSPVDPEADDGEVLLDYAVSDDPDPERLALARAQVAPILAQFADDAVASNILAGWQLGMSGPEICKELGISEHQYDAARKRIARGVRLRRGDA